MAVMWPEIAELHRTKESRETSDGRLANAFTSAIGRYLKYTGNVVCLHKGNPRSQPPVRPQWFIRKAWDDKALSFGGKIIATQMASEVTEATAFSSEGILDGGAEFTSASQPGEKKHACRVCPRSFAYKGNRNSHERTQHPKEIKQLVSGITGACGDGPFHTERAFSLHRRSCVPCRQAREEDIFGSARLSQPPPVTKASPSSATPPVVTPRAFAPLRGATKAPAPIHQRGVTVVPPGGYVAEAEYQKLLAENERLRSRLGQALTDLAMLEGS
jgi:hypothetical protein